MEQPAEDRLKPPNGLTFIEFYEQCCENCRIVGWLGKENPPEADPINVYSEVPWGTYVPWSPSCPLCQQLKHMIPSEFEVKGVRLELRRLEETLYNNPSYRSNDTEPYDYLVACYPWPEKSKHPGFRGVPALFFVLVDRPGGWQHEVKAVSIKPVGVDWKAIGQWIEHCTTNHSVCAGIPVLLHVRGLKMIDCETGLVEPFLDSTVPYVALSYVWGHQSPTRKGYPQTIVDSIEIVLALGFRYLWVDRICIDQEDNVHKSTQIAMMDRIYSEAHFTIIACSDDAEQGLPGMGTFARKLQQPLWLGDWQLERTLSAPTSICDSRWASRGWTYQEGFFSRRKLFFTEHGVALQCASRYYDETVSRSLPDEDEMRKDLIPSILRFMAPLTLSEHSGRVLHDLLWQYPKREITYESDALNACLGIFNYMGFKHIWGVTIWDEPLSINLCWRLQSMVDCSLERKDFPSWSWIRWKASIQPGQWARPTSIAAIKTLLSNGVELDILDNPSYKDNLGTVCSGRTLRITGTFHTARFDVVDGGAGKVCCILSSSCGAGFAIPTFPDLLNNSRTWTAADFKDVEVLEVSPLFKNDSGTYTGEFLLVRKHLETYLRVGAAVAEYDKLRTNFEDYQFDVGTIPMSGSYIHTIDLI